MTDGGEPVATWGEKEGVHIDVYDLGANKYRLSVQNPTLFRVSFSMDFDPRKYVKTSKTLPIKVDLDSEHSAQQQVTGHKLTLEVGLKGRVQPKLVGVCYSSLPGSSEGLLSTPYAMPWKDQRFECIQGFNTSYTHTGPLRYGADFKMNPSTPILAARAGTVVDLQDEGKGTKIFRGSNQYAGKGSIGDYVIIRHEANIYTCYQHLKENSVTVKASDDVAEGQKLGESGNTGKTTEPHLHFDVRSLVNCKWETIEFWLKGKDDKALAIKEGKNY